MNYYLDCEFIEGFHKPLFGKRRHFIDLISIALVCEDGREYYALSNEFNPKMASSWVKENVLEPIRLSWYPAMDVRGKIHFDQSGTMMQYQNQPIEWIIKHFGKSNKQIAQEIKEFVYAQEYKRSRGISPDANIEICQYISDDRLLLTNHTAQDHPTCNVSDFDIQFYGYYSDYDHVLLCSLFGTMMDLPSGFPMYTRDLKQTLDKKEQKLMEDNKNRIQNLVLPTISSLKAHPDYPKETNAHNALADARWIKELHEFLKKL